MFSREFSGSNTSRQNAAELLHYHRVLMGHRVLHRGRPVFFVMASRRLAEGEGYLVLDEQVGEPLGKFGQAFVYAAVNADVWELFFWHGQHELEGVVRV